jgi:hypothetical protein|tara:strand:- start:4025 stop:4936 length:912 start_codon:yes stop_codon:yes gene_type:complete
MPSLSFKKEVEVRVVYNSTRYKIDVTEIEFSQTFQEKSYAVKTLHNQSSFEGSVINRANPAEFSLNFYLLKEDKHKVLFDRLLDSAQFDIYISNPGGVPLGTLPNPIPDQVWKLENCVIQDGNFEINKSRPLRLSISGEATKLSKFSGTIPGSEPAATTSTYIVPTLSTLTLGSDDVSGSVIGVNVELQNDIKWNKYDTLQGAAAVTDVATTMYPSTFSKGKQVLGGSIQKYLIEGSTSVLTWNQDTSLRLKAGNGTQGLDFNISNCSFTNRMSAGGIFGEEYNWRMTQRPTALSSVITYTTA